MRTNDIPFKFLQPEKLTGKTQSGLLHWVENFMTLVKPDNGIEWVSIALFQTDHRQLSKMIADLAKRAETRIYDVRPAVYVNHGNSEGLIIRADLVTGNYRQPLLTIKTFGGLNEAWHLAQNLSIVLELVMVHGQEPVIVDAVNLLAIKRYRKQETLVVGLDEVFSLQIGELDRRVEYPLHAVEEVRAAQRAAIEHDLAKLIAAFDLKRIAAKEAPQLKESPFQIGGVDFSAVRFSEPRPHWRVKLVETGEVLMPGAGSISTESVPKMKADIQAHFERLGKDRAVFRDSFGLKTAQAA